MHGNRTSHTHNRLLTCTAGWAGAASSRRPAWWAAGRKGGVSGRCEGGVSSGSEGRGEQQGVW